MSNINLITLSTYLGIWIVFGLIHTLFAADQVKSLFPLESTAYRIIFNITNTITFLIVIYLVPSPLDPISHWFSLGNGQKIITIALVFIGGAITAWGLSEWDLEAFVGFKNEGDELSTTGPYLFSRHPVYSGLIIVFFSLFLVQPNEGTLSWLIGAGGYFAVGSISEERKLEEQFGEKYMSYRSQVGWLFPHRFRHFKHLLIGRLVLDTSMEEQ